VDFVVVDVFGQQLVEERARFGILVIIVIKQRECLAVNITKAVVVI